MGLLLIPVYDINISLQLTVDRQSKSIYFPWPSNWYQNLLNSNALTYQGEHINNDTMHVLPIDKDQMEMPELVMDWVA